MGELADSAPAYPFEDVDVSFGINRQRMGGEEFIGVGFVHLGFGFAAAAFDALTIAEGSHGLIFSVDDGD